MGRKVFISILGISYYRIVKYYFEDDKNKFYETNFIQEATLRYYKDKGIDFNDIYIFLTHKAKQNNWEDPAQKENRNGFPPYKGLSKILSELNFNYHEVNIPNGNTEQELWEIFDAIYQVIEPEDEIYLDVTHSFRSLPIFLIVLLNYAKTLKNIKVRKITYGNWEARDDKNFAPVIDLTAVNELQNWSVAANSFIKYGNVEQLTELSEAIDLSDLNHYFKQIFNVRGIEIIKAKKISYVKKQLRKENLPNEPEPFKILKDNILQNIEKLKENSILNGFYAVKFCLDHNLTQQGMTLLEEFVITKVLEDIGLFNKHKVYRYRNAVAKSLQKRNIGEIDVKLLLQKEKQKNQDKINEFKEIVANVFKLEYKEELTNIFSQFSEIGRNDINHAGFRDKPMKVNELKSLLSDSYDRIKQIFNL